MACKFAEKRNAWCQGAISLRGRRAGSSGQLSHSTTKRANSISALSLARSQTSSDEVQSLLPPTLSLPHAHGQDHSSFMPVVQTGWDSQRSGVRLGPTMKDHSSQAQVKPIMGIMFCMCDGSRLRYARLALQESDMASPGTPRVLNRWHSSAYVSEGQAAVELFYRLNHARQTMDYVRRQVGAACACNPNCRSLQRELKRLSAAAVRPAVCCGFWVSSRAQNLSMPVQLAFAGPWHPCVSLSDIKQCRKAHAY